MMKVIKTKVGHYGCGHGHKSEECLEIHCLGEPYDGIYCLPCFCAAIVRRLAIPKVELVVPAPRPEPEPETEAPNEEGEGEPVEPEEGDEDDGRVPGVPEDPDESGDESGTD
jgi:hypothetical protein